MCVYLFDVQCTYVFWSTAFVLQFVEVQCRTFHTGSTIRDKQRHRTDIDRGSAVFDIVVLFEVDALFRPEF